MDNNKDLEHATDVQHFLADLDAGLFERKIGIALSDVAAGVVDHDQQGEVTVKFKMKRVAGSGSVVVSHELSYKRPTAKGHQAEVNTTSTVMHVAKGGKMTIYPMGAETADFFLS